ncbi:uncharacterized protein DUF4397 [Kribbella voronezhensis]|uniref:Uncharacterized protein DUF4397 n=1 Tax=Kribbella voronezhensis TaxID=2512212 RepID=A0A4R7TCR6_9ACTN|nr:uncharacterized protein DUF4397 [Kribbella voronezhensis]
MLERSVFKPFRRVAEKPRKSATKISRIRGPHSLRVISLALAVMIAAASALFAVPADAAGKGELHVIQGLPGRSLDISVDGRTVARGVQGAEVVGPLDVAAGQRKVTARDGGKVVIERVVTVGAGSNLDVVIHRPAAPTAAPVITSYANKLTGVPKDKAALRVAHTAAVGPADIRVNGKVLFANVANGESLDVVVPAGKYSVDIVPAGATSPVVLGPLSLAVKAGYLTRVFAIGEPNSKTMNVVVTSLRLPGTGSDRPGLVNTGTGGQAAGLMNDEQSPVAPIALVALLLVGASVVTVRKVVRR